MLNDFAAATACRKFRYLPLNQIPLEVGDSGLVPVFDPTPAYNLVNIYPGYQPVPNVVAAVSVENLLNVDYTKYMCCSTAAGCVVPSPGITWTVLSTRHFQRGGGRGQQLLI